MAKVPHYNAFISYRHHPDDIKVAEAIHKSLERYKLPRSLKKQGKRAMRIFRDREELPITSSLTDTITQALRNSDYQIVICSTHTKESYWVQREIEAFLETHTKDQILTVIVDGEPYDVIPEILTYRDVVDPATGETLRENLEPLSCDWRLNKRQAMKTELPRLAAVLLGCTYDDLMQRQKQYRMQKLLVGGAAALALSLGFAGYFLYSSIRIQNNLNQSLRNQSEYLASTSAEVLQSGDRLTAMALALAGLPSEENERPYVPKTELALSKALSMYDHTTALRAIRTFTADAPVLRFTLTPDGTVLYALDSRCVVTAWDTATGQRLSSVQLPDDNTASLLQADANGNCIVFNGTPKSGNFGELYCYTPAGELLWEYDDAEDFTLTEDKRTLLALQNRYPFGENDRNAHALLTIDISDGSFSAPPRRLDFKGGPWSISFYSTSYREGEPYLLARTAYNKCTVFALDPITGKETELPVHSRPQPARMHTTADGKYLVCATESQTSISDPRAVKHRFGDQPATVYCYSKNGKLLWSRNLTAYMTTELVTLEEIPESGNYFLQFGNGLFVLDSETGEVLSSCISPSPPQHMEVGAGETFCILTNGYTGSFSYSDKGTVSVSYNHKKDELWLNMDSPIVEDIKQVAEQDGYYVSVDQSPTILHYSYDANTDYELIDNVGQRLSAAMVNSVKLGQTYAVLELYGYLYCYDLTTNEFMWESPWSTNGYAAMGFSADDSVFYINHYSGEVICVDNAKDETTSIPYPVHLSRTSGDNIFLNQHLYYLYDDEAGQNLYLMDWNVDTGEYETYDCFPEGIVAGWDPYEFEATILHADSQRVIIRMDNGSLHEFTFSDEQLKEIITQVDENPILYVDDRRILLSDDNTVQVLNADRQLQMTLTLPGVNVASLFFHDDILYALGADGVLYRFTPDGTALDKIPLQVDKYFFNYANTREEADTPISWDITRDGDLIINAMETGNILSLSGGGCRAHINEMFGYHAPTDSFICYNSDSDLFLRYPRLSRDGLMTRAKEVLGDFTLTEDQRSAYGLN